MSLSALPIFLTPSAAGSVKSAMSAGIACPFLHELNHFRVKTTSQKSDFCIREYLANFYIVAQAQTGESICKTYNPAAMSSIENVLNKMDDIVDQCKQQNLRTGYFAVLYRFVTQRIKKGIDNGEFDDNDRMEKLDTLFAQRFFDAFDAYYNSSGKPVTTSWQHAFDSANSPDYIVMQHMLLGINAHINLDLGIAAAETMEGEDLELIHDDYDHINAILASLVDDVTSNMSRISLFFGPLIRLAGNADDMLVKFSIIAARDGAWEFALKYTAARDKELAIRERDKKISNLAGRLTSSGPLLSFILKIIRWGEFRPLQTNMNRLAGIIK